MTCDERQGLKLYERRPRPLLFHGKLLDADRAVQDPAVRPFLARHSVMPPTSCRLPTTTTTTIAATALQTTSSSSRPRRFTQDDRLRTEPRYTLTTRLDCPHTPSADCVDPTRGTHQRPCRTRRTLLDGDGADARNRFEKSLYDLIRGLRNHKGNEKEFIQKTLKECRAEIRGQDMGQSTPFWHSAHE